MSHSIVFTGKIREGATLEDTRRQLAEMFRISDPAVLDRVFSGKPVLLRKGLDEHEARKQEMILLMAGAVCEVRAAPAATPVTAPSPPAQAESAPATAAGESEPTVTTSPPPQVIATRPARLELSGHAYSAASPAQQTTATPQPRSTPPLSLIPSAPLATTAPTNESADYLPAALRGGLSMAPEAETQIAQAAYEPVKITNHGRPGEALIDELHAPWDPAFVPDAVRGLSWAGFFAPLLWGSFNGMPLSFVPLLCVRLFRHFVPAWGWMVFYLGFGTFYLLRGRELAWEHKRWRNAEHFNRVQRNWTIGCFAFFLLSMYGLLHLINLQHQQGQQAQIAQEMTRTEFAVLQARTPEARDAAIAERNRVRDSYLATIADPAIRERERQAFASADEAVEERNPLAQPPAAAPDTSLPPQ